MRKFKHIPTGNIYKQGVFANDNKFFFKGDPIPLTIVTSGKDWEEVKEPMYEILSFNLGLNLIAEKIGNIFTLQNIVYTEEQLLNSKNYKIKSIKRLSDGAIFTVGKDARLKHWDDNMYRLKAITKTESSFTFELTQDGHRAIYSNIEDFVDPITVKWTKDGVFFQKNKTPIYYLYKENVRWNIFGKTVSYPFSLRADNFLCFSTIQARDKFLEDNQPKPLFKSNDGYNIFIGDEYFTISLRGEFIKNVANAECFGTYTFKNIESAKEYRLMNTPCMSINDFAKIYTSANSTNPNYKQPMALRALAESKLN